MSINAIVQILIKPFFARLNVGHSLDYFVETAVQTNPPPSVSIFRATVHAGPLSGDRGRPGGQPLHAAQRRHPIGRTTARAPRGRSGGG